MRIDLSSLISAQAARLQPRQPAPAPAAGDASAGFEPLAFRKAPQGADQPKPALQASSAPVVGRLDIKI
jgi:hypothetical protein